MVAVERIRFARESDVVKRYEFILGINTKRSLISLKPLNSIVSKDLVIDVFCFGVACIQAAPCPL